MKQKCAVLNKEHNATNRKKQTSIRISDVIGRGRVHVIVGFMATAIRRLIVIVSARFGLLHF
jgi:hypothetical protein